MLMQIMLVCISDTDADIEGAEDVDFTDDSLDATSAGHTDDAETCK